MFFYVKSSGQTCIEIYINIRTLLVFKIFPKKFFFKKQYLASSTECYRYFLFIFLVEVLDLY